jgi:hypothetical protein
MNFCKHERNRKYLYTSHFKVQKSNLSVLTCTDMSAKLYANEMKLTSLSRICDVPTCWEVPTWFCSRLQLYIVILPLNFCPEHLSILIVLPVNICLYYTAFCSKYIKSGFELFHIKTATKSLVMSVAQQTEGLQHLPPELPYFPVDNAHPKLFRRFFLCIDNAHLLYNAHPIPRMFIFANLDLFYR